MNFRQDQQKRRSGHLQGVWKSRALYPPAARLKSNLARCEVTWENRKKVVGGKILNAAWPSLQCFYKAEAVEYKVNKKKKKVLACLRTEDPLRNLLCMFR